MRDLSRLNWEGRRLHPKLCHRGRGGIVVDHGAMTPSLARHDTQQHDKDGRMGPTAGRPPDESSYGR